MVNVNMVSLTRRSSMLVFLTCFCKYPNSDVCLLCSSGGTEGADARAADSSSPCKRCFVLIGIADADVAVVGTSLSAALEDGVGDTPAGVPIEDGTRKSSKFICSSSVFAACSEDFRSCAIPLGAFWTGRGVSLRTLGQH